MEKLRNSFKYVKNVAVLVLVPILFTLIFASVYSVNYVEDIPLAVLDLDQTSASRSIIESFEDGGGFLITMRAETQDEISEALLSGKVSAGIIIPPNLEKDIMGKKSPGLLVLIDGTNIVIGNNAYSYAANVINTINIGIQADILEAGDMVPYEAEQNLSTLALADRMLYAPYSSYFMYTFAGFLGIFVQQTFMGVSAPVFVEEKQRLRGLGAYRDKSGLTVSKIVTEVLAYGLLTLVASLACLLVAHTVTGYPLRGSLLLVLAVQIVFILDMAAVTILISAFFNEVSHCVQFVMLLSIPTFLTSGYVWPEFMMPPHFMQIVKMIWPLHYYVNPMKDLMLKGAGFAEVAPYLSDGLLYAAVWLPVAIIVFCLKIKRTRNETVL